MQVIPSQFDTNSRMQVILSQSDTSSPIQSTSICYLNGLPRGHKTRGGYLSEESGAPVQATIIHKGVTESRNATLNTRRFESSAGKVYADAAIRNST